MKDLYLKKLGPMLSYLETMIVCGKFAPGEALPSLRKLAADFSISRGLANQGIEILAERGWVEIRHGSGAYVLARREAANSEQRFRIGVVLETAELDRTYCAHIYRGVREAAAAHPECRLIEYSFGRYEDFDATIWRTISRDSDAVLLIGACDLVIKDVPHSIPAVGVEMGNDYDGWLSLLSLDPYDAARQSVAYFQARGIRRVIEYSFSGDPLHDLRRLLFRTAWESAGGEFQVCSRTEVPPESDGATGYWFSGSSGYSYWVNEYQQATGREFGAGRCCLTWDGKGLLIPNFPQSDTIDCDWPLIGNAALEETLRRVRNPGTPARRIYQHGMLRLI